MSGHLEVICGPMYAGKSEELIRRLRRVAIAKQRAIVFKPYIDNRFSVEEVVSHNGSKITAYPVEDTMDLTNYMYQDHLFGTEYDVVAIDEVQFFANDIVKCINGLTTTGTRVIVSGLDMDFRKKPFGPMPQLLSIAKVVTKLRSVCQSCGADDAMYTQRLLNGEPAPLSGETIVVGAGEQYEARCENCWKAG